MSSISWQPSGSIPFILYPKDKKQGEVWQLSLVDTFTGNFDRPQQPHGVERFRIG